MWMKNKRLWRNKSGSNLWVKVHKIRQKKDNLITVFLKVHLSKSIYISEMWKMWIKNKLFDNQIVMC